MVDISRLLGTTSAGALGKKLDAADGSEDGWINASIWNQFIQEKGGKTINEKISIVDAMKSITTYAVKAGTQLGSNANAVVDEWIKPENIPTSDGKNTTQSTGTENVGNTDAKPERPATPATPSANETSTQNATNSNNTQNSDNIHETIKTNPPTPAKVILPK